jgi:hypothetical protein
LRLEINERFGGCCVRCGNSDERVLHIDHVHGGGQKELRQGHGGGLAYYYRVRRDNSGKYQLLCANCNAIKRFEEKEAGGMTQHKAKRKPLT